MISKQTASYMYALGLNNKTVSIEIFGQLIYHTRTVKCFTECQITYSNVQSG